MKKSTVPSKNLFQKGVDAGFENLVDPKLLVYWRYRRGVDAGRRRWQAFLNSPPGYELGYKVPPEKESRRFRDECGSPGVQSEDLAELTRRAMEPSRKPSHSFFDEVFRCVEASSGA